MKKVTLCALALCSLAVSAQTQDVPVNRERYPDYVNPQKAYPSEPRLMKFVPVEGEAGSRNNALKALEDELPEYWNNADTKYFPPVFAQAGGSCGSASRIGYMFTHEINALRNLSGKDPENQYPTHFVWLHTSGNDGKNEFVEFIGVPNVTVYGGRTYSELFGYQEEGNQDFGWMTGYDKWMNAISNRMESPTSNPLTVQTKEGRLAAKSWLYNHAGDTDFKAGGLIGLGVASGGIWYDIPKTAANDAAGVTGKRYVHRWGQSVDHAVTMVGWDDRIEFDLDGNGIAGEEDKDEKGAWIIVNSWGNWNNSGFVYCPYKYAGPVSNKETGEMYGGYWSGELYHARKNFRPTRILKVKMNYTHRSEILLQAGISTDLNATEPETVVDIHYFRYAGDGRNGNASPAPEVPMLGKWQGTLHHEPMEFCYDLTDFSNVFDTNKPLKYFFIVNRKSETSLGSGNIYEASILDTEKDTEGVESPFDLGGEKFTISTDGKRMMISAIVQGNGYEPVTNLTLSENGISWDAPKKNSHSVASYNIYKDDALLGNTTARTYQVSGGKTYSVTAVYSDGTESSKVSVSTSVENNNVVSSFEDAGFTIPNVFAKKYDECTLEFYIKPTAFRNWNCTAGPGWGTYMHHFNVDGSFTCGWNTTSGNRVTSSTKFTLNTWQLVSIVVKGNKLTIYRNGAEVGSTTSSTYSGLGGFGDLVFSSADASKWQNGSFDEIRIWNYARSRAEILGSSRIRRQEFYGDVMPEGLIAYYKGDTFLGEDGQYYLRDCVGGNHASVQGVKDNPEKSSDLTLVTPNTQASVAVNIPEKVYAGVPVNLTATRSDAVNKIWWTITECGITEKNVISPTVTFAKPGQYTATVYGSSYNGTVVNDEVQINVEAAPALDANFSMSATTLPCSERLSVYVNNYVEACGYEWTFAGAETEKAYGAKAGATFLQAGDYDVTLTITSADGRKATSTQKVHVTMVAPEADFTVTEPVVLKGTPVTLSSKARYGATELEWILDGPARKTTIIDGMKEQLWTPEYPGRYTVTLTAKNSIGSHAVSKDNALVVCNADSKNGLSFSQPSAQVTFPLSSRITRAFTLEFWANPTTLSGECWGIGDGKNLLIKVNSNGAMIVTINGTEIKSNNNFVKEGIWSHYAIRRDSRGILRFMRDGELIQSVTNGVNKDALTDMESITLGVTGLPINGAIDELRLWGTDYAALRTTCNAPLENPAEYIKSDLIVYFDFNQSGGNVIDRSGNGNDGIRAGFGPDGDAWALSKGVFSLYQGDKLGDEVVTSVDNVSQENGIVAGRKGVYTLSGQYLGTSADNLPAGLYIIDGKKAVVE